MENGWEFSTTTRTDSELHQYKTEGSYILQFAEECLTADPKAETLRVDIWNAFVEYCSENGINRDKISKQMVNKELEEHFKLQRSRNSVSRQHTYVGIRINK
jgi:putative DNA primase/helicase